MIRDQFVLDINEEIIVDNFAGGGASTGIEMALGRWIYLTSNAGAVTSLHTENCGKGCVRTVMIETQGIGQFSRGVGR